MSNEDVLVKCGYNNLNEYQKYIKIVGKLMLVAEDLKLTAYFLANNNKTVVWKTVKMEELNIAEVLEAESEIFEILPGITNFIYPAGNFVNIK